MKKVNFVPVLAVLGIAILICVPLIYLKAQESDENQQEQIEALIKKLGSPKQAERESASQKLIEIGEPALKKLEEATKYDDPEIAMRARRIINIIERKTSDRTDTEDKDDSAIRPLMKKFTIYSKILTDKGDVTIKISDNEVEVVETIIDDDGKETKKTYSADSVDEFKKKYPDIAKKYNISEEGYSFGGSSARRGKKTIDEWLKDFDDDDWLKDFGKRWEDDFGDAGKLQEDIRKRIEEWSKKFEERFKDKDWIKEWLKRKDEDSDKETEEDTLKEKKVEKPVKIDLGGKLTTVDEPLREQLGLEQDIGVVVEDVDKDGLLGRAGVKNFDVIIELNGKTVDSVLGFRRMLADALSQSDSAEITIIRKGKREKLTISK